MTLRIDYQSRSFPASISRSGNLITSWDELLWAAITIGRPSVYHVFQHGLISFHEAIFRLSLVRMAVEEDLGGRLQRTAAFSALDPTEKGMVSYFLGMVICKLFASRLLSAPWLLHLDVFQRSLNPALLGRSRPDLVGEDNSGNWHAFESKGRSSKPSGADIRKAKAQAQRLVSVNGQACSLQIGSFAFFRSNILEFYWRDPEPTQRPLELPRPEGEWSYYYEPAVSLASPPKDMGIASELHDSDVDVEIHPTIRELVDAKRWSEAQATAKKLSAQFKSQGYQPDGLKVTAGRSWAKRRPEG